MTEHLAAQFVAGVQFLDTLLVNVDMEQSRMHQYAVRLHALSLALFFFHEFED